MRSSRYLVNLKTLFCEFLNSQTKLHLLFIFLNITALSSCSLLTDQVKKKKGSTEIVVPVLNSIGAPETVYFTSTTSYPFTWFAATGTDVSYKVEVFHSARCSGTPVSTATQSATQYVFSSLTDGLSYSLRLTAFNNNGTSEAQCSPTITVDLQAPTVTFVNPASNLTTGTGNYTFSWTAVDAGLSGLRATDTFTVEQFNNGTCSGTATATTLTTSTSLMWAALSTGTTYSVRVKAGDVAGNQSSAVCSSSVTASAGALTLAITDPTTSSSSYARQTTVNIAIGNDTGAAKWCLSETQSTAPADGSAACAAPGWVLSRPTAFTLSAGDGTKTLYVYAANGSGVVDQTVIQASIILDGTVPATPTVSLSDPTTSSTSYTNVSTANLSISGDTGAVKWCSIEQASASAAPTAPLYNDACFVSPRPTTQVLGATGLRKVYVYTLDVAGNVSAAAATSSIDYSTTAPAAFTISGIDGGTDTTVDAIAETLPPRVNWADTTGESSYEITIFENDGVTVACPAKTAAANATSYTYLLADCGSLVDGTNYKARVVAVSVHNNRTTATNSPFVFTYAVPVPATVITTAMSTLTPVDTSGSDTGAVELGARFSTTIDGTVTALRYYKLAVNTDACVGHLWTSGGVLLGSVTFAGGAVSGWQEVALASPVAITAGTNYVVSYYAPNGRYAFTDNFFTSAYDMGPVHFPADGTGGLGNGLFKYNGVSIFPTDTFQASNYYIDVAFSSVAPPKIKGVTGGVDILADVDLTSGLNPTVNWSKWPSATSHDVTIYEDDGTTVKCATVNVAVPAVSYNFSSCTLTANTYYKIGLIGKNGGATQAASNDLYRFYSGVDVLPVYPNYGAQWMDYITNYNGGTNQINQPDIDCVGYNVSKILPCIHGGEKKRVATNLTSCTGLTATDSLGVFKWWCDDSSGTAIFYSIDFVKGKGLKDLVNAASWKSNSVTVMNGASTVAQTVSTTWWTNPIAALPDNSGSGLADLNNGTYAKGTILTLAASRETGGYSLSGEKIGVVTLGSSVLSYNGRAAKNCNGNTDRCIVRMISKFGWLEGNFDGIPSSGNTASVGIAGEEVLGRVHNSVVTNAGAGVNIYGTSYMHLSNVRIREIPSGGLTITGTYNLVRDLETTRVGTSWGVGVTIAAWSGDASYNTLIDVTSVGNARGVQVYSSGHNNLFHRLRASQNSAGAIYMQDATTYENMFVDVIAQNNDAGVYALDAPRNIFMNSTFVNNVSVGLQIESASHQNTIQNIVSANNPYGFGLSGTANNNNTYSQIVAISNSLDGISFNSSSNNTKFSGAIVIGNNAHNCTVTGGTNPGLVNNTCTTAGTDGSSAYTAGYLSDAILRINRSVASTFVGKLTSADTSNASDDVNGGASFPGTPSLFDWFNFDNRFRLWGISGSAFPNANNIGNWSSGSGKIWVWRLLASDATLFIRTGDGATANDPFVGGGACPSAVNGNVAITDQQTSPHTYLLNATEILDPYDTDYGLTGNHNGLCETGENCIYTPNFGAYQGEGTLQPCTFTDGTVSGVKMFGYPTNGQ